MIKKLVLSVALMTLSAFALAEGKHKVVIQVSSADQKTQAIAMNNAVNVQKHYGVDNVEIELVAYGPGLSMLSKNGKHNQRVSSLAQQEIRFTACANTMAEIEEQGKKLGKKLELIGGVEVVPAGVARIMELQQQGYAYIRP